MARFGGGTESECPAAVRTGTLEGTWPPAAILPRGASTALHCSFDSESPPAAARTGGDIEFDFRGGDTGFDSKSPPAAARTGGDIDIDYDFSGGDIDFDVRGYDAHDPPSALAFSSTQEILE